MGPLYDVSLMGSEPLDVIYPDGSRVPVPVDSWRGPLLPGDGSVLDRCSGPALDIGCGPGRMAAALRARGLPALGIDVTDSAITLAIRAGAVAIRASVFDDLPDEGHWQTVLLLDGSIGIGGSPRLLLRRVRDLLCSTGLALVEVEGPGETSQQVQLRLAFGAELGTPFPWARLAVQDIEAVAASAGLGMTEVWEESARWFVCLHRG